MKSVKLFCVLYLSVIAPAVASDKPPLEVYMKGIRYNSLEDYHDMKMAAPAAVSKVSPLKPAEEKIVYEAAITPDIAKHLKTMGYEHGMRRLQMDFKQNWENPQPKFEITAQEVEDRIRALTGGRDEAVLLIAEPDKLRIMALEKDKLPEGPAK